MSYEIVYFFVCWLFQFLLFAAVGSQAGIITPLAPASYGIALPAAGHAVDYYVSIRTHNTAQLVSQLSAASTISQSLATIQYYIKKCAARQTENRVSWHRALFPLINGYQYFGGQYCLLLQGEALTFGKYTQVYQA